MNSTLDEVNYWPGYVDALINVVLNLLFLVGVFTVGLVCLNSEAVLKEQKSAELKASNLLAGKSDADRQKNARALLAAMQKPTSTSNEEKYQAPKINVIYFGVPRPSADKEGPIFRDKKNDLPIRITPEKIAEMVSKGHVISSFIFEVNQYKLPKEQSLPSTLLANVSTKWLLLVVSDPKNIRTSREAFTRLIAVRSVMSDAGIPIENIQIQVAPAPEGVSTPLNLDLNVFLINQSL